jgi:hypothetical protein
MALQKHDGMSGVSGQAFVKVKLPPGSHRGGVLSGRWCMRWCKARWFQTK